MMHWQFLKLGQLVVALILLALAQADYKIDDANSTIQYSGNYWSRSTSDNLDFSKIYDGTA
jgi:hypothetical protein